MELLFLTLLVVIMVVALTSGYPVAFALPGSAILTIGLAALCGYLFADDSSAYFAQGTPLQWLSAGVTNFRGVYWEVERDTLIAIPLFVFMGIMLQRSKIAEDLLIAMAQLFGPVPGGLGISVVFVGALLAATTGIVGATVVAMGLISLPAMLRNNYAKPLASGTICAAGTLGQIIPPSIVLIILADQLSSAANQAQTMRKAEYKQATGNFAMPTEFDVVSASAGDMFLGAFLPGLLLVGLYMLYILIYAVIRPSVAPPVPYAGSYNRAFFSKVFLSLAPPLTLIIVVLGSILTGVATVNQAGAIGAVGALIMGGYRLSGDNMRRYTPAIIAIVSLLVIFTLRQFFDLNIKSIDDDNDLIAIILALLAVFALLFAVVWSAWRTYKIDNTLTGVVIETAKTTSMVFIILLGAAMLTAAFRGFGGEELVKHFLTGLPGGFISQLLVVMLVIFILGFFLDFIEIAVVVVPITAPILLADPSANVTAVWLGVMIGVNMQTSFLTPPFGFSLFYLRGVADKVVKTLDIYKGATPFILLQLIALIVVGLYPAMVNYLPNRTYLTSATAPPPQNPQIQLCLEENLFAYYDTHQNELHAAIDAVEGVNLESLPQEHRDAIANSFSLAKDAITMRHQVRAASDATEQYSVTYRTLHHNTRALQRERRKLELQISEAEVALDRLRRRDPDNFASQSKNQELIADLQQELMLIVIPEHWESARSDFLSLTKAERHARRQYRRTADEAYEPLQLTRRLLAETDELSAYSQQLTVIMNSRETNGELIWAGIREIERSMAQLAGSKYIRAMLRKAMRILKKNPDDLAMIKPHLLQAQQLIQIEADWRNRAKKEIGEPLETYDQAIHSSIGARLQPRISQSLAKFIARCKSGHQDVSLHF